MLDPEFGLSSDRNLVIIHLEKPKKAPRTLTTPAKTAAIISGLVNIHLFYTRGRLTLEESMETLNLQPPTIEWRVYRNDNAVMTLALVDSNDAAIDLTDWDFDGKVREFPADVTELSTLGIVKNENILTIALDTADLTLISYFDIEGINSTTSTVSTVIRGQIFVEEDVTR
jgi:hypothetical protein